MSDKYILIYLYSYMCIYILYVEYPMNYNSSPWNVGGFNPFVSTHLQIEDL